MAITPSATTVINYANTFALTAGKKIAITIDGVEQDSYTVPVGKSAKVRVNLNGKES